MRVLCSNFTYTVYLLLFLGLLCPGVELTLRRLLLALQYMCSVGRRSSWLCATTSASSCGPVRWDSATRLEHCGRHYTAPPLPPPPSSPPPLPSLPPASAVYHDVQSLPVSPRGTVVRGHGVKGRRSAPQEGSQRNYLVAEVRSSYESGRSFTGTCTCTCLRIFKIHVFASLGFTHTHTHSVLCIL